MKVFLKILSEKLKNNLIYFDNKIPSLKNFEFKRFDDKCFLLGLYHKYAEKHQHDF